MEKPFRFEDPDKCPVCKSEHSIEAFNNRGKRIYFTTCLVSGETDFRKKNIQVLECNHCRKSFFPEWHNNIPYPGIDGNIDIFLDNFKFYKSVDP